MKLILSRFSFFPSPSFFLAILVPLFVIDTHSGGSSGGQWERAARDASVCVCVRRFQLLLSGFFSLLVNTGDSFLGLATFDTRFAMRSTARTFSNWMLAL